jgi:hypothetical protein
MFAGGNIPARSPPIHAGPLRARVRSVEDRLVPPTRNDRLLPEKDDARNTRTHGMLATQGHHTTHTTMISPAASAFDAHLRAHDDGTYGIDRST